ncbi:sugar kinase [Candidatus Micrarchaeota archaeon]|nr:sugar kinase [Candidatus Micrarchaeota archaeon]
MIISTGSIALDTTRTPFQTIERALGGAASFFSYCATYFSPVRLVGVVGEDFPAEHWKLLQDKGIDLAGVKKEGRTMFCDWNYHHDLHTREYNKLELNSLASFKPTVPMNWTKTPYVYLGTTLPEQQLSILKQVRNPSFTLMDTIEYYIDHDRKNLDEVIAKVDCVLLNDVEARKYANSANLIKAAKYVLDKGPKMVLIKKGENGCILFTANTILPSAAFPLETIIDPTGAGDSFAGGFLGHIARKGSRDVQTLKEAMAYGHVMGSFAVEDFGLRRLQTLTPGQLQSRYNLYKQMVCF